MKWGTAPSGGAHVDVTVTGTGPAGLTAKDVEVDDKNNNGRPDEQEDDATDAPDDGE